MTANDKALAHVQGASELTKRIQDEYISDIVRAWAGAWDDLQPQFEDALNDVMLDAQDGQVTRSKMVKATRLAKALEAAHTQLTLLSQENERLIVRDLDDAISAVVDANAAAIASQLPAGHAGLVVGWDRMDLDALAAIVTRTTQQVHAAHWPLADDAVAAMKKNLIRGIAIGDNPRKVRARMVRDTETFFNGGLARALNLARTEMMDSHRFASQASDEANKDVVKGWTWIADLSTRTCIACAVMHGTEHPMTEMGPKGHQSCRCTRMPITKSWAELGIPGVEDTTPTLQDGQAWFDNLTPDSQLDVMGKSQKRLDAYLNGDVQWHELAATKHTPAWRDSIIPVPEAVTDVELTKPEDVVDQNSPEWKYSPAATDAIIQAGRALLPRARHDDRGTFAQHREAHETASLVTAEGLTVNVDKALHPLLAALAQHGIRTVASCQDLREVVEATIPHRLAPLMRRPVRETLNYETVLTRREAFIRLRNDSQQEQTFIAAVGALDGVTVETVSLQTQVVFPLEKLEQLFALASR